MVVLFLVFFFKGISILFSVVVFPPTVQEVSPFSTSSPAFILIPHYSFDLQFSLGHQGDQTSQS